jgi:hypothetical protein
MAQCKFHRLARRKTPTEGVADGSFATPYSGSMIGAADATLAAMQ